MPSASIDRRIVNSPYAEPGRHWHYHRESRLFELVPGRQDARFAKNVLVSAPA